MAPSFCHKKESPNKSILGSVFVDLKKAFPEANFTATTRSSSGVQALTAAGAKAVVLDPATADYHETITNLASKSDVVINLADCDDLPLAEAVLKGLKLYKERTGKVTTLIHTSGTAVFFDDTKDGSYKPNGHFYDVRMTFCSQNLCKLTFVS